MADGDRRLVIVVDEPAHTGDDFRVAVARALIGYAHHLLEGRAGSQQSEIHTTLVPGLVLSAEYTDKHHS